jgi:hypothetical protein
VEHRSRTCLTSHSGKTPAGPPTTIRERLPCEKQRHADQ